MKVNKFKIFLFIFLFIFTYLIYAGDITYGNISISSKDIVKVYDGDTFYCNIPNYPDIVGKNISVRVYGIDTPEIKGKTKHEKELALKAKTVTLCCLKNAKVIELRNMRRDKYFRILAEVYVDGKSLKDILITEKLGREYYGKTKENWE